MSATVRVADDARLYVLDDEGVFFSEGRQELHTFNTPATFLWCCLEEGLGPDAMAAAYAQAFSIPAEEAGPIVEGVLRGWQGLGYVAGLDAAPDDDQATPFESALAWLLTDETLRRGFAASPLDTVRALGVTAEDASALAGLSPKELDAQAAAIAAAMRALRLAGTTPDIGSFGGDAPLAVALEARRAADGVGVTRTYRVLDTVLRVRTHTPAQEPYVHEPLAHLEVEDGGRPDVVLDVVEGAAGHVLLEDALPVARCAGLDELAPLVSGTVQRLATNRHRYVLEIHAGVVAAGDRLLMLPAAAGTGKTTLVAALIHSGFDFFSDEFAMLAGEELRVRPVPLSLTIKPGSLELLAPYRSDIAALPTHHREDDRQVRYLPPPGAPPAPETAYPVRWVVFPTRREGADGPGESLRPVTRPEGLRRLMEECLILPEQLDRGSVESLVRWLREVDFFELDVDPLPRAVETLRELTGLDDPEVSRSAR